MSSKYGNTKLIYNDIKFDSKLECEFYICLMKAKEEIQIVFKRKLEKIVLYFYQKEQRKRKNS